ncbi:MAG: hypothetical protein ACM3Q4_12405 [Acidobacteriota bacterium]
MKRFTLYCTLILFVTVFSSCSNGSNPTAQMGPDEPAMKSPITNVSLVQLPASTAPQSMAKATRVEVWITPEKGGDVPVSNSYTSIFGTTVTIEMNLHFEPGTVTEPKLITIALDSRTLTADFSPDGLVFEKPAILSATVSGIPSFFIPKDKDLRLYYINGLSFEEMNGTITANRQDGTITLADGEIPHFSLYGFGFTK